MYERFTDRARNIMQLANEEARRLNHEYIGTEHLLLGLVAEGSGVAAAVLKSLDVSLRKIRLEVEKIAVGGPEFAAADRLPQTPRAKQAIVFAMEEARSLNHNYVGSEHILLGLLREQEGVAAAVLMKLGVTLDAARQEVLSLLGRGLETPEGRMAAGVVQRPGAKLPSEPLQPIRPLGLRVQAIRESQSWNKPLRIAMVEIVWSLPVSAVLGLIAQSWLVFLIAWVLVSQQGVIRRFMTRWP